VDLLARLIPTGIWFLIALATSSIASETIWTGDGSLIAMLVASTRERIKKIADFIVDLASSNCKMLIGLYYCSKQV